MFNISRYKKKIFHMNDEIHKKIEAIFLLYDKRVNDSSFGHKDKIRLMNVFINQLIKHEEYEIAQAFTERKFRRIKKWKIERRGKLSLKIKLRFLRYKVSKLF